MTDRNEKILEGLTTAAEDREQFLLLEILERRQNMLRQGEESLFQMEQERD